MKTSAENPRRQQPAGVSPILALAMSTISFFAIAIMGLGMLAALTGKDMITAPGLGAAPVTIGMVGAVLAFGGLLWAALRPLRPTYPFAIVVGLAAALAHLFGVWLGSLFAGGDLVLATSMTAGLVGGGASLVVLFAGILSAWIGVALRRTKAHSPQWPWERE